MFDHLSITATDLRGTPGIRARCSPDYYAAFVRDPEGNRLEAVTRRPEDEK
jgi:hypothetical protein